MEAWHYLRCTDVLAKAGMEMGTTSNNALICASFTPIPTFPLKGEGQASVETERVSQGSPNG